MRAYCLHNIYMNILYQYFAEIRWPTLWTIYNLYCARGAQGWQKGAQQWKVYIRAVQVNVNNTCTDALYSLYYCIIHRQWFEITLIQIYFHYFNYFNLIFILIEFYRSYILVSPTIINLILYNNALIQIMVFDINT